MLFRHFLTYLAFTGLLSSCGAGQAGQSQLSSLRNDYESEFSQVVEKEFFELPSYMPTFLNSIGVNCHGSKSNNDCLKEFFREYDGQGIGISDDELSRAIDTRTSQISSFRFAVIVFIYLDSEGSNHSGSADVNGPDSIDSGKIIKELILMTTPLSELQAAAIIELHGRSNTHGRVGTSFYGNYEIDQRTDKILFIARNNLNPFHLQTIKYLNRIRRPDNQIIEGKVIDIALGNISYGLKNHDVVTRLAEVGVNDGGVYSYRAAMADLSATSIQMIDRFLAELESHRGRTGDKDELAKLLEEILPAPSK